MPGERAPRKTSKLSILTSEVKAGMALRLSRYFGTTSRFWMNMQTSYELEAAEDQLGKAVMRDVLPRTAA